MLTMAKCDVCDKEVDSSELVSTLAWVPYGKDFQKKEVKLCPECRDDFYRYFGAHPGTAVVETVPESSEEKIERLEKENEQLRRKILGLETTNQHLREKVERYYNQL